MTGGWGSTPIPRDHWPHVLELVRADNGGELPAWALSADLVYLADRANHPSRKHAFPGRRELERRWGLSEWATRRALRDPEWQAVCKRFGIALPDRRLDGPLGDHPASLPATTPHATPHATPHGTSERTQSTDSHPADHPAALPPTTPPPSTRARPSPRLHVSTSENSNTGSALVLVKPTEKQPTEPTRADDGIPGWAGKVRTDDRRAFVREVVAALSAIRERTIDPQRCGTDAGEVIALWTSLGRPPIAELRADLALVARWAREAPDAANDLRGVRSDGTTWGTDRSRSVSTLCVRSRWGDRIEAARRWLDHGAPLVRSLQAHPAAPTRSASALLATLDAGAPDVLDAADLA